MTPDATALRIAADMREQRDREAAERLRGLMGVKPARRLKIGALFAGYGGLDLAVSSVLDAEPVWFSEFDKGPSKILAHRFPGVPNHGDITKIDWATVEPVDILTGGSPCQDLSHAGKRAGMTEGTRSNLWVAMREAIAQLRPRLVVWENVRGAYSAEAASGLVDDARLLADTRRRDGEPVLRALGRVLGDLSDLGYDAQWHGLRAADVGAPHGRFRVFVVAYAASAGRAALDGQRREPAGVRAATATDSRRGLALLPTPRAGDGEKGEPNQRGSSGDLMLPSAVHSLLPTPAVNDMGAAYTPDEWDAWCEAQKAKHGNGNGHGKSLHIEATRLLLTPRAGEGGGNGPVEATRHSPGLQAIDYHAARWGQYAAAITRWEALTRPAPAPTERDWEKWEQRKARRLASRKPIGMRGSIRFLVDGPAPRLSAAFSEWMMGLPAGWVTDVPGITRNEALKALGNGVVPQQAAAALRLMLGAGVAA